MWASLIGSISSQLWCTSWLSTKVHEIVQIASMYLGLVLVSFLLNICGCCAADRQRFPAQLAWPRARSDGRAQRIAVPESCDSSISTPAAGYGAKTTSGQYWCSYSLDMTGCWCLQRMQSECGQHVLVQESIPQSRGAIACRTWTGKARSIVIAILRIDRTA